MGYQDGEKKSEETGIYVHQDFPDYMEYLRKSFLRNDFVKTHFSNPEETWNNVATINKQFHLSDELMKTVSDLSMKHSITWEEVTEYLDVLSVETLENMQAGLENVVNASDGINESEDEVVQRFNDYIQSRK